MIRGLTQVSWERVDVSFQKSKQRYIAHSTIQVTRYIQIYMLKLIEIIMTWAYFSFIFLF